MFPISAAYKLTYWFESHENHIGRTPLTARAVEISNLIVLPSAAYHLQMLLLVHVDTS